MDTQSYHISNSEIQNFKRCKRKWWLGWYRGLTPRYVDLASKQSSGIRIHEILATWYSPDRPEDLNLMQVALEVIERDRLSLTKALNINELYFEEDAPGKLLEFNKITTSERAMIEGYLEWLEETGADAELRILSSETPLVVPFGDFTFPELSITYQAYLVGIVDAQVQQLIDDSYWFIDHKTVQNFALPVRTLHMNEQMLHYIVLDTYSHNALSDFGTPRISGAIYNMIRRVGRTKSAQPPFYQRESCRYSIPELRAYMSHCYGVISDLLLIREGLRFNKNPQVAAYPSPRAECSWNCPFYSLCHLFDDGSYPEAMIEARYVQCDPLEARYGTILQQTGYDSMIQLNSNQRESSE